MPHTHTLSRKSYLTCTAQPSTMSIWTRIAWQPVCQRIYLCLCAWNTSPREYQSGKTSYHEFNSMVTVAYALRSHLTLDDVWFCACVFVFVGAFLSQFCVHSKHFVFCFFATKEQDETTESTSVQQLNTGRTHASETIWFCTLVGVTSRKFHGIFIIFFRSELSRGKNIVWPNRWVQLAYARVNAGRRRRRRRNHEEVIDWVTREQVNVFMFDVIFCGNICGQNVWLIDIKLLQNRIERDCDYDDVTLQTPTQSNVIVTTACAQTNRKRKLRRPDSEKTVQKIKNTKYLFACFDKSSTVSASAHVARGSYGYVVMCALTLKTGSAMWLYVECCWLENFQNRIHDIEH